MSEEWRVLRWEVGHVLCCSHWYLDGFIRPVLKHGPRSAVKCLWVHFMQWTLLKLILWYSLLKRHFNSGWTCSEVYWVLDQCLIWVLLPVLPPSNAQKWHLFGLYVCMVEAELLSASFLYNYVYIYTSFFGIFTIWNNFAVEAFCFNWEHMLTRACPLSPECCKLLRCLLA